MDRIPAAETVRRPERTAEGGDDSPRSSVFPDEPVPQILAEPGWQIWFRAGRRVPSVWGAAPSGIYVLALDLEKDAEITVGALGERKFPAGRHLLLHGTGHAGARGSTCASRAQNKRPAPVAHRPPSRAGKASDHLGSPGRRPFTGVPDRRPAAGRGRKDRGSRLRLIGLRLSRASVFYAP